MSPLGTMHTIELGLMPQLAEARVTGDDWTGIVTKEERKRRQNRLNQRALRRRKAEKTAQGQRFCLECNVIWQPQPGTATFINSAPVQQQSGNGYSQTAVRSWINPAILDPHDMLTAFSPAQLTRLVSQSLVPHHRLAALSNTSLACWYSRTTERLNKQLFSLSADHLLTLIQYNVYRGLMINIVILEATSIDFCEQERLFTREAGKKLPPSLLPTRLQETVVHPAWIDMFPVPKLRDNVIRRLGTFSDDELSSDVMGEVCESPEGPEEPPNDTIVGFSQDFLPGFNGGRWECSTTAGRKGFILWGDPWDLDAWEVTPGFLEKWWWIAEGCPEIIRATNRWREARGEEAIIMELE